MGLKSLLLESKVLNLMAMQGRLIQMTYSDFAMIPNILLHPNNEYPLERVFAGGGRRVDAYFA
jgi:hypothetical protein